MLTLRDGLLQDAPWHVSARRLHLSLSCRYCDGLLREVGGHRGRELGSGHVTATAINLAGQALPLPNGRQTQRLVQAEGRMG
eukprot:CAMPEP_0115590494 /NCGR_PEP_ID=MMETSP0272-20121206/9792_1 /TAXON_ID=71861 /ORGANISM="Scrippsiella trochoidea, Strain CCMP3099" /LENGTH=81 /DNA_ID=CAMNT_0003025689 /DNA_START=319 /DNA_END=560 /DNA_ORIENTATION=+